MEKKINIEDCYFHGLAGGIPFWDEGRVIAVCVQQLEKIIQFKGIYSRKILREKYGISYDEKDPIYNGDDYISLCIRHPADDEFVGEFATADPAFYIYVKYKMGIAICPDIINKCCFRQGNYKRLPGERQVLDTIYISDVTAIVMGLSNNEKILKRKEGILKDTGIPITDIDGNILTSTKEVEDIDVEKI